MEISFGKCRKKINPQESWQEHFFHPKNTFLKTGITNLAAAAAVAIIIAAAAVTIAATARLCCSLCWLVIALLSVICFHHHMPSCNHRHSCCRPLSPPIVVHCRHNRLLNENNPRLVSLSSSFTSVIVVVLLLACCWAVASSVKKNMDNKDNNNNGGGLWQHGQRDPTIVAFDNDNNKEDNGVILSGACIILPLFIARCCFCRQPLACLQCAMVGCYLCGPLPSLSLAAILRSLTTHQSEVSLPRRHDDRGRR